MTKDDSIAFKKQLKLNRKTYHKDTGTSGSG